MHRESVREISPEAAKVRISGIPFSDLPGQSALFAKYLGDPLSLSNFYPNAFDRPTGSAEFVPTVLQNYTTDRGRLCDALDRINKDLGAGNATLRNVDLLRRSNAVAVVTGQQTGLFTGPIYTIYKALSAIRLAEQLSSNGVDAAPVFWMATEDHDFEEVSTAAFIAESGRLVKHSYRPISYVEGVSVGNADIDQGIDAVIKSVFCEISRTAFSDEAQEIMRNTWRPGGRFGRAFGQTLMSLLGRFGIIMLDPTDTDLRRLAAPIYGEAIRSADRIVAAIRVRDEQLEVNGFHSQVKVEKDYFPLFWHDANGIRTPLRKTSEGVYRTKARGKEFGTAELLDIALKSPETLSPGVMLRPIVQDFLLPTVAYFGGGAEIAYFAQNSAAYEVLDRPVTPIFHRQSFTVVGAGHRRAMDKLSVNFPDLLEGPDEVLTEWEKRNVDPETAKVFADAEEAVNTQLAHIDHHLSQIDTTLLENAAKRRRKMIYHIGALRKKALRALTRKNGDAERRISSLCEALVPDGSLQERSLNVFFFVNIYGPKFIDVLYDAVDLNDKDHRIIDV